MSRFLTHTRNRKEINIDYQILPPPPPPSLPPPPPGTREEEYGEEKGSRDEIPHFCFIFFLLNTVCIRETDFQQPFECIHHHPSLTAVQKMDVPSDFQTLGCRFRASLILRPPLSQEARGELNPHSAVLFSFQFSISPELDKLTDRERRTTGEPNGRPPPSKNLIDKILYLLN